MSPEQVALRAPALRARAIATLGRLRFKELGPIEALEELEQSFVIKEGCRDEVKRWLRNIYRHGRVHKDIYQRGLTAIMVYLQIPEE